MIAIFLLSCSAVLALYCTFRRTWFAVLISALLVLTSAVFFVIQPIRPLWASYLCAASNVVAGGYLLIVFMARRLSLDVRLKMTHKVSVKCDDRHHAHV